MEVRRIPADSDDAVALREAMVSSVVRLYDADRGPGPSATDADFSQPGGAFVALYEDDRAVAGGGIKRLDDETCEIKRMYVVPEARGRGLGRVLLEALEAEARRMGYRAARLDTGPEQPGAQRMYEGAGYQPIGNFNANPFASFWGEKAL
jgi:GNAT superfamily N-acetyltransferase